MTKTIKILIIIIISIYIISGLFIYDKQRRFLYFPKQNTEHKEKDIFINNGLCDIHTIVINEGKKDAIIYFGGTAQTLSKITDYVKRQFPDKSIYLMNYPGYGLSTCKPTEKSIYKDSKIVYDYVKKNHNKISVIGKSLGTGVATYLASKRNIEKLVLITPYYSILSIAKERFPMYPVDLILKDKYLSGENIKYFKTKTLIVIAEKDKVVKLDNTKKLINEFPKKQLEILMIKNATHTDLYKSKKYFEKIKEFI